MKGNVDGVKLTVVCIQEAFHGAISPLQFSISFFFSRGRGGCVGMFCSRTGFVTSFLSIFVPPL